MTRHREGTPPHAEQPPTNTPLHHVSGVYGSGGFEDAGAMTQHPQVDLDGIHVDEGLAPLPVADLDAVEDRTHRKGVGGRQAIVKSTAGQHPWPLVFSSPDRVSGHPVCGPETAL